MSIQRCDVCDWPLANRPEDGCVLGNCCYRPESGSAEYYRIQKRKEALRTQRLAKLREEVVAQAIRWRKTKDYENEEADALCHDVDAQLAAEGEKCNG